MGVDPPTKISKTTNKEAYAFAKTDAMFQALVNHEREDISLLSEARMAVKSTLERTRAQRFLDIAQRGALPVPLNYYAAHTGRWGGSKGSGINMQNLSRGSFLRQAVHAPDGYVLLVADLAQIEPRVLAWLADDRYMLKVFGSGKDPYATFGAVLFGVPGMTKDTHPALRQSAKSALLGCGYGLGWASFAGQLMTGFLGADPVLYGISFAKQLGIRAKHCEAFMQDEEFVQRMKTIPRTCSNDELAVHCVVTKKIIDLYRDRAGPVVKLWRLCDDLISKCLVQDSNATRFGGRRTIKHKCLTFSDGKILLPSGLCLRYPDIQGNPDEKGRVQWTYGDKRRKKLYGGKLTENIVQAVARVIMTDGMLRIQKRYPVVMTSHDEAGMLVLEDEAEEAVKWVREQMIKEPRYMPGLPLEVSIDYAKRYGDAKV
jgi:DNA polymerase